MEPLTPLLPISKNLSVSNVHSLLLQRTSEISSSSDTAEIDNSAISSASQLEKLKISESHLLVEQKTVSANSQERKTLLTEDSKVLANNSTSNNENQNR